MCKYIAIMLFILCNGLTLLYFDDPNADAKVKVAFVLLSMMIWSSLFSFIGALRKW
jgi:hypothetical protein